MPVKEYNPTSPARRAMSVTDFSVLSDKKPEKKLLVSAKKTGGRNSYGRITVRHIGGGNKRKIRIIDWKRKKDSIPATVTFAALAITSATTRDVPRPMTSTKPTLFRVGEAIAFTRYPL